MRSADEIKKGLECHINGECNQSCPYFGIKFGCGPHMVPDALDLILQLETDKQQLEGMLTHMNQLRDAAAGRALKMEERVRQLEAERDTAVEDLRYIGKLRENNCTFCLYYNHGDGSKECIRCGMFGEDHWQWRGVPEREG